MAEHTEDATACCGATRTDDVVLGTSNSGDSFFSTISRRLDAAAPIIGKILLVGSIVWAVFAVSAIIIPTEYERADVARRLDERTIAVEEQKQHLRELYEYADALDDPYFIDQYARSEYKFAPADPAKKS